MEMSVDAEFGFWGLFRASPGRTLVYTVLPLLVAVAQLVNSYVNGGSLVATGAFAAALVAYSVLVTRYRLAAFRRVSLP